jgi:hypothetical protein
VTERSLSMARRRAIIRAQASALPFSWS